jgi:antitoxin (DNA-binding transcriptional repressor) of toxin-antitoxin stability system
MNDSDETPIAEVIPIDRTSTNRILGEDAGRVEIADDFDAPLDPETMR